MYLNRIFRQLNPYRIPLPCNGILIIKSWVLSPLKIIYAPSKTALPLDCLSPYLSHSLVPPPRILPALLEGESYLFSPNPSSYRSGMNYEVSLFLNNFFVSLKK